MDSLHQNDAALRERSAPWLWIAAVWCGVGLFDATQTVFVMRSEGMQHAWGRLFFTLTVSWLPWALATPMVLRLADRYPPARWRRVETWFVHLAVCFCIGLIFAEYEVLIDGGTRLPMSRRYRKELEGRMAAKGGSS